MLAVALIGLICIGLLGLSGVLVWVRNNRAMEQAAVATAPLSTVVPPSATPTSTITPTPTNTPEPTPTGTSVVSADQAEASQGEQDGDSQPLPPPESGAEEEPGTPLEVTPTATLVVQPTVGSPPPPADPGGVQPPQAEIIPGSGGILPTADRTLLSWIGGGLLLILLAYGVLYRLRWFW